MRDMRTRRIIAIVVLALLIVFAVGVAFLAWRGVPAFHGLGLLGGWRMMGGRGRVGWPFMMGGGGLLFWPFVLGIVLLFAWLAGRNPGPDRPSSALDILRQRYARGEITKDQFDQMRRDLLA
jgi:putative membrane protein